MVSSIVFCPSFESKLLSPLLGGVMGVSEMLAIACVSDCEDVLFEGR